MQIPRHLIFDTEQNTIYVVPAIALSLFVFAYSIRFGQISILAFYACWLPPFLVTPRLLLERPLPVFLLLLLPTYAAASTLWSDVPTVTLRAAIQYGTTVFCGLVAARMTSVPNLALGGTIGGLLVLLYSAASGNYSYDAVDGSYAFSGAFGSKNQLGYFATLALIFGAALLVVFRSRRWVWPLAAATAALAAAMLWISDSATSLISAALALLTIALARALVSLAPVLRRAAIAVLLSASVAAALAAARLGAFNAVLAAFGKDTTLTGRTYLWSQGLEIGSGNPAVGLGYNAFWTHGRPAAEHLWEAFYITSRTGFHFHNTLIEAYVGLGLVGVALVATLSLSLFLMPLRAVLPRTASGSTLICAGLSLLFLVRSAVEVDFLTPYTAGSFLVPFVLLRMADHRRRRRAQPDDEPFRVVPRSSASQRLGVDA